MQGSGQEVLSKQLIFLYKNGGDVEMKLILRNNQDWQVDEDEQTQVSALKYII